MPPMPTIRLMRPIAAAHAIPGPANDIVEADGLGDGSREYGRDHRQAALDDATRRDPPPENRNREPQPQTQELARLLATLNGMADRLHRWHEEAVAGHSAEIAKLAVEIARKILRHKVGKGDYEIQAIVEEAIKESPTCQDIVVHLNPDDLAPCQELQRQDPQSPFAGLGLTADRNIGRGECLVETPKGIVKSFIEEHLERISEALQRIQ